MYNLISLSDANTINLESVNSIQLEAGGVEGITGVASTSAVGTVVALLGAGAALAGVEATSAVGFTESDNVGITGVAGTGSVGGVSQSKTVALTGVQGTSVVYGLGGVTSVEGGVVRKAVTEISGLFHLVNEEVVILADGNVISGKKVSATGTITLDRKASRVHIGKKFTSEIEKLDIEAPKQTIQGLKTKVHYVTLRMRKTRGLLVGPNSANLRQMKFRENERMSDPTDLRTGDKSITIEPTWKSNGRVFIRQPFPLPMTILAAIPNITVGGK